MQNIHVEGLTDTYPEFFEKTPSNAFLNWQYDGGYPTPATGAPPPDSAGQTVPAVGMWARNCTERV